MKEKQTEDTLKPRGAATKSASHAKPLSLHPLSVDEALKLLVSVKPPKQTASKKSSKKSSSRAS